MWPQIWIFGRSFQHYLVFRTSVLVLYWKYVRSLFCLCVTYMSLVLALDETAYKVVESLQTWQPLPAVQSPGHICPDRGKEATSANHGCLFQFLYVYYVLNKTKPSPHCLPLLQIWYEHFSIAGDVLSSDDKHVMCGPDKADGSRLGVAFL